MEQGEVAGALEVTRRESNCLTTLKVLEMICDLFRVCALEGRGRERESRGARSKREERLLQMAISCRRGVMPERRQEVWDGAEGGITEG